MQVLILIPTKNKSHKNMYLGECLIFLHPDTYKVAWRTGWELSTSSSFHFTENAINNNNNIITHHAHHDHDEDNNIKQQEASSLL